MPPPYRGYDVTYDLIYQLTEEKTYINNTGDQQDSISQHEVSSKEEPMAKTQTGTEDRIR